jgi:hypothetical protein
LVLYQMALLVKYIIFGYLALGVVGLVSRNLIFSVMMRLSTMVTLLLFYDTIFEYIK